MFTFATTAVTSSASSPSPATSPSSDRTVPLASADQIHAYLVKTHRIGNRTRLRFARLLAALAESRLYVQLGHPSITQYAEQCFGVQRSETYELLRVAEIIDERPGCRTAFEDGNLSWSALKLITRVASNETENEWLAFAAERSFSEFRAEVQDALKKNRAHPRSDRYGLPNLIVKLTLELTREEQARLETALEKAGAEIAPALGDERLETKDVLLYLAERFLRTDPEGTPDGRKERDDSPYTILYHQCGTCRRARLMTADGPVEVAPESVERLADDAVEVTPGQLDDVNEDDDKDLVPPVDRPNPASLTRRVRLRDGDRCRNPGCRRREELHAHHIHYRSHGGRTIPANEVAVCTTCHALIHAGLLEVSGDPFSRLSWQPRSKSLVLDSGDDAAALGEIPMVQVESAVADSSASATADSTRGDSDELESLAGALVRLGLTRKEACARLKWAHEELRRAGGDASDEQQLLQRALCA